MLNNRHKEFFCYNTSKEMKQCSRCSSICVLTDYSTLVCTGCGIETQVGLIPQMVPLNGAPLGITHYSRYKRFVNYVDCIINPLKASHPPNKVLYLLHEFAPFSGPKEIIQRLKMLNARNKSYQHLHMYCVKYQSNYRIHKQVSKLIRHQLIRSFNFIEDLFVHKCKKSFFSYPWLLIQLLHLFGLSEYTQYAKNIGCKRRKQKYVRLWKELGVDIMLLERRMVSEALID
jgi:hypothetical protein